MYTGITQGLFPVTYLKKENGILTYKVKLTDNLLQGLKIGASVAVDGVCQTVVTINDDEVAFNAIDETLNKTTLFNLKLDQVVSIERSATMGAEIGGHAMYGHVFGTAEVLERKQIDDNLQITFKLNNPEMSQYIFKKGFIGVDGSSLTVNDINLDQHTFVVNLIPHTLQITNFASKNRGDKVNIELDANAVTIVETCKRMFIK